MFDSLPHLLKHFPQFCVSLEEQKSFVLPTDSDANLFVFGPVGAVLFVSSVVFGAFSGVVTVFVAVVSVFFSVDVFVLFSVVVVVIVVVVVVVVSICVFSMTQVK